MAKKDLTQAEKIALLDAQLSTVIAVLSETISGFSTDIESFTQSEIDTDTTLNEMQKTKIRAAATEVKDRFKREKK